MLDRVDVARRAAAGIAAADPVLASGAAEAVASLEHAVTRARLIEQALTDAPAEQVERRLADVRAGSDPGKAKLVAALASQLAVQRRMQAVLDAYNADIERLLVEARDRPRAGAGGRGAAAERLGALQDELSTLAARLAGAGGESTTEGCCSGRSAGPTIRPMSTIANKLHRNRRRAFIESYEFSASLRNKLVEELGTAHRADIALDGLRAWYLACLYATAS